MPDFEDPFKPSEPTIVRPRPGAGRRGASDQTAVRPAAAPPPAVEAVPAAALEALGIGLNPLVRAAGPLLMLAGGLRGSLSGPEVGGLRRHALDEIRRFEERARGAGIAQEVVVAARYVLCAALDEAVLSTPWGAQSEWAQQTLLVALHRETWGGEKFFDMLDRISQDPARHIDLMELQYLCLALGFAGKYQVADRGHTRLAEIQRDLFRRIRDQRGAPPAELSLRWQGVENRRRLLQYLPWWVVAAAVLAVLILTYTALEFRLARHAQPVHAALLRLGLEEFSAPVAPVVAAGPTLKQLLRDDEAAGTLSVEEEGGRTRVTLLAPDLFASASATINPAYAATLQRVAAAINQVPGRVLVVGHTDDQRLRSSTYRDNFELSRARAVGVADVLKAGLDNPGRVEHNGVGSTDPRYTPESDPGNRARNRRVEIIHVRGS